MDVERTHEREITEPIDLCLPSGRLDQAAIGWSRTPLHRANLRGWGRTKRWEYWCVQSPDVALAVTVSSLDYLALHTVWVCEFDPNGGGEECERSAIVPLPRGLRFPDRSGGGDVDAAARGLQVSIGVRDDGAMLRARTDRVEAEVRVHRPPGHESLGVVIPWSERRFQYTVKDNTLPAEGWVRIDGREHRFEPGAAWAVLDHGRGRWPYATTWNWGSGSGRAGDRTIGLQLGGKWTAGTGMTENAVCVDGRLHKIGEELVWEYDRSDWTAPWHVTAPATGRLDLTLRPTFERAARTQAVAIATEVHQCFGTWEGEIVTDDGERLRVDGVRGFAEEARMRW